MNRRRFSIAIETSTPTGQIALGCNGQLLETASLAQLQRHNLQLMPAIDRLFHAHQAAPADLDRVYLSIGPGSFSGLRVAVASVKMLCLSLQARVVAVPTLDVVAQNVPPSDRRLLVGLSLKRESLYTGCFTHDGRRWRLQDEPGLRSIEDILADCSDRCLLLADPLPALPPDDGHRLQVLPAPLAVPDVRIVWQLGQAMADAGRWADPMTLTPLYVRPPEAQEIWDRRYGAGRGPQDLEPPR